MAQAAYNSSNLGMKLLMEVELVSSYRMLCFLWSCEYCLLLTIYSLVWFWNYTCGFCNSTSLKIFDSLEDFLVISYAYQVCGTFDKCYLVIHEEFLNKSVSAEFLIDDVFEIYAVLDVRDNVFLYKIAFSMLNGNCLFVFVYQEHLILSSTKPLQVVN